MYRLCNDTIGSLSNDDGDGNEDGEKSYWFRLEKQQLCTCITLFLHISLPSPHEHNVEVLNFKFCRGRENDLVNLSSQNEEENAAFQAVDFFRIGQKLNGKYRAS